MDKKISISELKKQEIVKGIEPLIEDICENIFNTISNEDAIRFYLEDRLDRMEENPFLVLDESSFRDLKGDHKETIEALKKLKREPEVYFKEATFLCREINSLTIPEDIDFQVIDDGWQNSYRFVIDEDSIQWLAEMLKTEPYFLLKYCRVTIEGD